MGKKKLHEHKTLDVEVNMDMTPMIDLVFQMVMFFIIVTDFTQQDIALLELPWSTVGKEDKGEDPSRLVINITAPLPSSAAARASLAPSQRKQADRIIVQGKPMTFVKLTQWLKNRGVADKRYIDEKNSRHSSRSLLVRCDGAQAFDYVKGVLQVCALPEVAIYKVEIATSEKKAP